jgi:hypothetical protein
VKKTVYEAKAKPKRKVNRPGDKKERRGLGVFYFFMVLWAAATPIMTSRGINKKAMPAEAGSFTRLPGKRPQSEGRGRKRLMVNYLKGELKGLKRILRSRFLF